MPEPRPWLVEIWTIDGSTAAATDSSSDWKAASAPLPLPRSMAGAADWVGAGEAPVVCAGELVAARSPETEQAAVRRATVVRSSGRRLFMAFEGSRPGR